MNHSLFVSGFESFEDLIRDRNRFIERNRSAPDVFSQRFSRDKLHDQELPTGGFLDAVNGCDVGMIQRCQNARFALETFCSFGVMGERIRKQLDRNTTAQPGVGCLIHLAHAACSQVAGDFVMCEFRSDHVRTRGPHLSRWRLACDALHFVENWRQLPYARRSFKRRSTC